MATTRVYILAKELGVKSSAIVQKCQDEGLDVKNHMSIISASLATSICEWFSGGKNAKKINTSVYMDKVTSNTINNVTTIKKAAKQGHAEAQIKLGAMYKKALGVPQDYKEASKRESKAEKQISKKTVKTTKSLKDINNFIRRCKHCGEEIFSEACEKEGYLIDECLDCHNELAHKIVKNGNIHIVGGHDSSRSSSQEDWSDSFNDMGSDFWEDHYAKFERE